MSLKIEAEVLIDAEPCVIAWADKLIFVGTEDGSIKTFDSNLAAGVSWTAHSAQLFALCADDENVYSSSNDGGIRVWSYKGEKLAELATAGADVGVLRIFDKHLYAGDEAGNVIVYENNTEKARYNLLEEVKDLGFSSPLLFTVRDLDVTITEIYHESSKNRYLTRHTMEGRAPLAVSGNRLLIMARGGNSLRLHDASANTKFKLLNEIKVSDMIVTSLSLTGDIVWTAGWDGYVKRWKIIGDRLESAGEINLGSCINALVAVKSDVIYAVLSGGKVMHVKSV